ncbi:carboxyl-terminal processing protease [Halopseudomonas sabulinigri]|uniref:Carboxyl-terminal processing protease n=1 Tax=Halopseudomonas sabulinigri TaxID=472181 RepID=A0A1H1RTW9_9GAMM|nr:S41 family peptidase [Halopseudomonas sabulinigri]SDS39115.1 carboxyl-terminal processing protease [Halopseudomonas sabulinigri]
MYKLFSVRRVGAVAVGVILTVAAGCAPVKPSSGYSAQQRAAREAPATSLAELIYLEMQAVHLEPPASDQILGTRIVEALAARLDPDRLYLLESDLQAAASTASQWPSRYRANDLESPRELIRRLHRRVKARAALAIDMLSTESLFESVTVPVVPADRAWAASMAELESRWKAVLQQQVASSAELGLDRRTTVDVWLSSYGKLPQEMLAEHPVDSCMDCMHALVAAYDSASTYYPQHGVNFQLGLVGVGLTLRLVGDRTEIVNIAPAGPASRETGLRQGDIILAVGESDTQLQTVLGWSLDKTVELIRGKAGSTVFLKVIRLKKEAPAEVSLIALRREEVPLQEAAVSGSLIESIRDGRSRRVGVVRVPSFYFDYRAHRRGDANPASSARDLGRVLADLKGQGAEAIVLDMRGNGGGSLKEAVDLTAWFMAPETVVFMQGRDDRTQPMTPDAQAVVYNQPLVILLNRNSASGTELFAAALRDRGRAVLVGEGTWGSGLVRYPHQLANRPHTGISQPGELYITVARLYRVDGEGIQLTGLKPDLLLPSDLPLMRKPDPLALPAKSIAVAPPPTMGLKPSAFATLQDLHAARLAAAGPDSDDTDSFWLEQAVEVAVDLAMLGKDESR